MSDRDYWDSKGNLKNLDLRSARENMVSRVAITFVLQEVSKCFL